MATKSVTIEGLKPPLFDFLPVPINMNPGLPLGSSPVAPLTGLPSLVPNLGTTAFSSQKKVVPGKQQSAPPKDTDTDAMTLQGVLKRSTEGLDDSCALKVHQHANKYLEKRLTQLAKDLSLAETVVSTQDKQMQKQTTFISTLKQCISALEKKVECLEATSKKNMVELAIASEKLRVHEITAKSASAPNIPEVRETECIDDEIKLFSRKIKTINTQTAANTRKRRARVSTTTTRYNPELENLRPQMGPQQKKRKTVSCEKGIMFHDLRSSIKTWISSLSLTEKTKLYYRNNIEHILADFNCWTTKEVLALKTEHIRKCYALKNPHLYIAPFNSFCKYISNNDKQTK